MKWKPLNLYVHDHQETLLQGTDTQHGSTIACLWQFAEEIWSPVADWIASPLPGQFIYWSPNLPNFRIWLFFSRNKVFKKVK